MRAPIPPFTQETAIVKVRAAEDGWNGQKPDAVAQAYSADSKWRNRDQFIEGRDEIAEFLKSKWSIEHEYRLIKELFAFHGNRIAVRFAYEYRTTSGDWFRAYGNENWVFNDEGLMAQRHASINDVAIEEHERLFLWPLGRRPDDHPGLSSLGL